MAFEEPGVKAGTLTVCAGVAKSFIYSADECRLHAHIVERLVRFKLSQIGEFWHQDYQSKKTPNFIQIHSAVKFVYNGSAKKTPALINRANG